MTTPAKTAATRTAKPVLATEPADPETWTRLAAPFDVSQIEKLPKPLSREDRDKGRCAEGSRFTADGYVCGGWHTRSVHLDYIGHAGITMRLNDVVGPGGWTLTAVAVDERDVPIVPRSGELWAELTVLGVVKRDVAANYNSTQEAWGDALRRCAMRFGIGTYLWAKSDAARELAQFREPAPGEDPAEVAQATADKLAEQPWPSATIESVAAANRELEDQPVTFRGNPMTLGGAIALVRVEAHERETAQAAAQPPAQEPSSPATAPVPADAPASPAQGGDQGETPQQAAQDLAREALHSGTADEVRALYRGAGELRALDVLAVLGDDDLDAIGAPRDVTAVTLGGLLMTVASYITKHGAAVRDVGTPAAPTPAPTGDDPWAADAAQGWPDAHTPAP